MRSLLGERYDDFTDAYRNKPRHKALRVNTRKISVGDFKALFPGELKQNPLCHNSFYADVKPSLDPLYHAGLYYMQEPSASAAVAAFAPFIGSRVLDLCAAPGGKSTQAAEYMKGGVLFCNDPEFKRVKALCENIERLGVDNAIVTCRTAGAYLSAGFEDYFDTIIADVPCSGGGMMRYEQVPYSEEITLGCAARQKEILSSAVRLLARGGYMLYSTCTFSECENEDNIRFLRSLGMETVDIPLLSGEERGIDTPNARRIYPMNFDGEGHFFCVLTKPFGGISDLPPLRKKVKNIRFGGAEIKVASALGREFIDMDFPDCEGLKPVRVGVETAINPKTREQAFEAYYSLIHALDRDMTEKFGAVEAGESACDYLCGKQLDISAPRGYNAVLYKGYALGAGYCSAGGDGADALKNGYPKRLRIKK